MRQINNHIAICVATYKRPDLLKECLTKINLLELPKKNKIFLIVVDNDVNETAKPIVGLFNKNYNFPIYYFVESDRGISSTRNRLIDESLKLKSNIICFIDDDEFPKKNWLTSYLNALIKYDADVVTGPVIPITNKAQSDLITYDTKFEAGHTPRHVAAGNVLFKSKLIKEQGLRFDPIYNFTGGEDFHFFDRSSLKQNKHIWVADAIVYEHITAKRQTKKYLFFRHFTGGINNVIQYKYKKGVAAAWPHFILKIIGKIFGSIIAFITYITTFKKSRLEKCIIKLASAIGYLFGLFNIIIERYR
jgi:succinoglycan biosynthesis protein ExoM